MTFTATKFATAAFAASMAVATASDAATYSNTTPIAIPETGTSGPASPFPSTIDVSGEGTIQNLTVDLIGLSHTFPDDIFVGLVAPSGTSVVLMSDAGGSTNVFSIDVTFDDDAAGPMPNGGPLTTGSYQVSQYGDVEVLPAPAPTFSFGTTLAAFDGENADGIWSLFVFDDFMADSGSISGGWALNINVAPPSAAVPLPASLPLLLAGVGALGWMRRRKRA